MEAKHKPLAKCGKFCYNIVQEKRPKALIIVEDYGKKKKTKLPKKKINSTGTATCIATRILGTSRGIVPDCLFIDLNT